jgi:hypothetical protein
MESVPRLSSRRKSVGSSVFGNTSLSLPCEKINLTREEYSLVPPQTPDAVNPLVITYLKSEFAKLNSKNTLTIEDLHGGKPWVADYKHWNYQAAKTATEVRSSTLSSIL